MTGSSELTGIARQVCTVLKEELAEHGISHEAEARIYNKRTVGVQGDQRSYSYIAEVSIDEDVWNPEFLDSLSTRITNEVQDVNRVVYVIGSTSD